jgi:Ca2+-transporting ATPase
MHILWVGTLIGAITVGTQAFVMATGPPRWQTMVFTTLTFCQLFHVMAIRTGRQSLFQAGLASNPPLLGAVLLGAALQLAVIYLPFLNAVMKTQPLAAGELAICVLLPGTVFAAVEVEKWLARRGVLRRGMPAPRPPAAE